MRPILDICHQPMLHRIPVNIVHTRLQILLIPDKVLPESPLPDPALARAAARCGISSPRQGLRERGLDQPPARRKIRVSVWQRPHAMQMIRQDAHGHRLEWKLFRDFLIRRAQAANLIRQQKAPPILQRHREEISAARHIQASIVRHASPVGCIRPQAVMHRQAKREKWCITACGLMHPTRLQRSNGEFRPSATQAIILVQTQSRILFSIKLLA